MPRIARVVAVGVPHHITQRGNSRQPVFSTDEDRHVYLDLLAEYSAKYGMYLWGYCLMSNHVHLIGLPEKPDSMARALGRTHACYARYWNARRRNCGHVWQARFYSCSLDSSHMWRALSYVERNPVRAGFALAAEEWPSSSAQTHALGQAPRLPLALGPWREVYTPDGWRQVLRTSVDEEAWCKRFHVSTMTGRPLGSDEFVKEVEKAIGRIIRPDRPGPRPRANAAASGVEFGG